MSVAFIKTPESPSAGLAGIVSPAVAIDHNIAEALPDKPANPPTDAPQDSAAEEDDPAGDSPERALKEPDSFL